MSPISKKNRLITVVLALLTALPLLAQPDFDPERDVVLRSILYPHRFVNIKNGFLIIEIGIPEDIYFTKNDNDIFNIQLDYDEDYLKLEKHNIHYNNKNDKDLLDAWLAVINIPINQICDVKDDKNIVITGKVRFEVSVKFTKELISESIVKEFSEELVLGTSQLNKETFFDFPIRTSILNPVLIGGERAIKRYTRKHFLSPYETGPDVPGKVMVCFLVTKDGTTQDVRTIQVRPYGLGFEEAGKRVMESMRFLPGYSTLDNNYIEVEMNKIITFDEDY